MAKRKSENNAEKTEKKKEEKPAKIKVVFTGETLFSNKKDAFTLYEKSRFGEAKEGKIFYSLFEALYLLERGKIEVTEGRKKLNFERLIEKLKELDKRIQIKYIVFKDMRAR